MAADPLAGRVSSFHEDGWYDVVAGAGALADRVAALYETHGAPVADAAAPDDVLVDLLLGVQSLAERLGATVAACEADTDPLLAAPPSPLPRRALR